MTAMGMAPTLPGSVVMMAAMMLPGALPAIARRAADRDGVLAAPAFAGSYLGMWTLAAVALWLLYRPPGPAIAGALIVAAGLYELTPLKRECRIRCRQHTRSGTWFGLCCVGSSAGLMLVLVAVDVMSVPLMCAVGTVVLAQKLLPPRRVVDVPLALAIVALGAITTLV